MPKQWKNSEKDLWLYGTDLKAATYLALNSSKKTKPIRNATKRCLKQYRHSEEECVKNLAGKLFKRFDDLFTFIFHEGVEPTNNIAERGIRPAVQWRKICFGNRSNNGAVLTSRLLTVTRTCWLQKRNPLEFLVEAITAHRSGQAAPSLIQFEFSIKM